MREFLEAGQASTAAHRPFELRLADGSEIRADTIAELIGGIIEGYEDAGDDTDALEARVSYAEDHASTMQGITLLELASDGAQEGLSEDDRLFLLTPKDQPVGGHYDGPVDLVLTTTHYEPFTDDERPTGRIVWLDPETETSFVNTLAAASGMQFTTRE
ncbi:hypothetical protein [Pseudoclavibacter caeni]|jgi:hypothetical protein|uniref:Uncharacterized protein n=1 Tax=Pseudoclavibacter caeni TaxID=908846 RepID=A0A7C8BNB6_9MICO|nr:hypothetical protein [Pseudoclavibacter caeni]KAB1632363.1 hypothetical protein F8O02_04970 [Pseudoclavibacter caeni]NYJ97606.1 hypothetical protein [Pseudoclavibacter caeni]